MEAALLIDFFSDDIQPVLFYLIVRGEGGVEGGRHSLFSNLLLDSLSFRSHDLYVVRVLHADLVVALPPILFFLMMFASCVDHFVVPEIEGWTVDYEERKA